MNTGVMHDGTQNASVLHETSENLSNTQQSLQSVMDLLNVLRRQQPADLAMLETVASHFARFMGRPCEEIGIEELSDNRDEFRRHLQECKYKRNTIRSYSNYASILYTTATRMGWVRPTPLLPEAWQLVLDRIPRTEQREPRFTPLVKHLARRGLLPQNVTEDDLSDWVDAYVRRGRSLEYARVQINLLRRILVEAGLNHRLVPERIKRDPYGSQ